MNYCDPKSPEGKAKLAALDSLLDELSYAGVIEEKMKSKEEPAEGSEEPSDLAELAAAAEEGDESDETPAEETSEHETGEESPDEPPVFMSIDMNEQRRKKLPPPRGPVKKRSRA